VRFRHKVRQEEGNIDFGQGAKSHSQGQDGTMNRSKMVPWEVSESERQPVPYLLKFHEMHSSRVFFNLLKLSYCSFGVESFEF
jgi:hypothetical protein